MNASNARPISFGEKAFAVCALLYASTAFIRLLISPEEYSAVGDEVTASLTKQVLWLTTYAIAAYFLASRGSSIIKALKDAPFLIALISCAGMSVLWSGSRSVSIISVAALAGNSLIGFYFGIRYSLSQFLRLLGWFYGVVVLCTFLSPILIRDYAAEGGYWTGFFGNKNTLGMNMTVGFLVFVMLSRSAIKRKWLHRGFSALCTILIFLSGSATCIVIFFVLVCALVIQAFIEKYSLSTVSRKVFAASALSCSTMFAWWHLNGIFSSLGKSEDLTGRVGLWGILILMARDKPFLGYGYGGFWVYGGPAQAVWDTLNSDPVLFPHAHNGYLQFLLDCGIVGLTLLLALLFTTFRNAWSYSRVTRNFWPFYFVLFLVLYNLTETTLAAKNNVTWLLFVALVVQLVRSFPILKGNAVQLKATCPAKVRIATAAT